MEIEIWDDDPQYVFVVENFYIYHFLDPSFGMYIYTYKY